MHDVLLPVVTWALTAALGAFAGWLAAKVKAVAGKRDESERATKRLLEDIDALTLMVCRLTIYNDKFSVEEKLDAYKTYRDKGGNHQTKTYMDKLLGEDVDAYLDKHPI